MQKPKGLELRATQRREVNSVEDEMSLAGSVLEI